MESPKVLAITKRTADLCGTQALLHGAGFALVTATNMAVAGTVIRAMRVKAAIVCHGSWSDQERDSIASDLAVNHPEVRIVMRCPGCTACDEATCTAGVLSDSLPLTQLITALAY